MGDSKIMKLSEQAQLDNQIAMLEMEIDNSTNRIMQLERSIYSLDVQIIMLKKIIKSLSEVL
jgi:peptidoglycan hydrolase CwlO-like protein